MNLEFSFEQAIELPVNSSIKPSVKKMVKQIPDSSFVPSPASSPIVFVQKELIGEKKLIHERAVTRAQKYLVAEAALLESIIEADKKRLFEDFGLTHLTPYCVKYLGLSEDVAANFVRVAGKSYEVPELKAAIDEGKISVSKAKAITSVVNPENQKTWIEKAESLSKNKLEKEIANISPKPIKPEKTKTEGPNRVRVEFYLTEEESEHFRRVQSLLCQKRKKQVNLAETQAELLKCYLDKHDPVRRAERKQDKVNQDKIKKFSNDKLQSQQSETPQVHNQTLKSSCHPPQDGRELKAARTLHPNGSLAPASRSKRTKLPASPSKRTRLPASVVHAVNLRDQGLCQAKLPDHSLCFNSKWLHLHHIIPKSEGGKDSAENLITLCSAHHRLWHARE